MQKAITKYKFILLFILTIAISALLFVHFLSGSELTEKQAMIAVFGNYNENQKNSIWKNINIPQKNTNRFFSAGTGIASTIFFQSYREDGHKKFFLITKTIPTDIYFQCHACCPLISAAIFAKSKGRWKIEAQNLFIMYEGEYGVPPKVELIQIGNDRFAARLEYEHRWDLLLETGITLLIPYLGHIEKAYQQIIYFDNFNDCGSIQQCAAYKTQIDLDKSTKDDFYKIRTTKFGTNIDHTQGHIAVPIDEMAVYHFQNGKYVQISWKGYPKRKYNWIDSDD